MAQDNQNFVFGGLDTDTDLRTVKSDRYIDANDVEHFIDDQNTIGGIRPAKGTKLAYTIPNITPQINSYRIPFITTSSTDYKFVMYDKDNTEYNIGEFFAIGTNIAAVASIGTSLSSAILALPNIGFVTAYTNTVSYQTVAVQEGGYRLDLAGSYKPYSIVCFTKPAGTSTYTQTPVITLQDAINYTAEMQPLASVLLGDYEYVLSKAIDQAYCEIGAATRDLNGDWTYTRIAGSEQFNLPTTEVISLRAELVGNDKVGLYWVDNTNKPKVFYVNVNLSNSVFRYEWDTLLGVLTGVYYNINGTYNLNNIGAQTDLQIFNNEAIVTVQRQIATGGKLKSGGKRYYVRFGVNGVENATPFNEIGEYTIVYKADNESPRNAVKIKGDAAAEVTTKQIVLNVENCKADIFNFIELVCVEYIGGAADATLVGRYDITSETTTIIHSGFELNSQTFDAKELPNDTPVILTAKVAEIKKNRYNLANTRIDGDSNDYATIAKNITISSGRKTIDKVGNVFTGSGTTTFNVSNYLIAENTTSNGTSTGTFFKDDPDVVVNSNPYSAYSNGYYNVTPITAGYQKISLNFSVGYYYSNGGTIRVVGAVYNGGVLQRFFYDRQVTVFSGVYSASISSNEVFNDGDVVFFDWYVNHSGGGSYTVSASSFQSILTSGSSLDFGQDLTVNEYQKSENVANNMGYMLYEPYQYYIRFHKKSGYITSPYYIGTHTIYPQDFNPLIVGYGRDLQLTDAAGNPYVYHPIFSNIDISSIKNDIDGISFWRAEISNPTVLASGINIMANKIASEGYYTGYYASNPQGTLYGAANPLGNEAVRNYASFISPDNLYKDGDLVKFQEGDKMVNIGQPTVLNSNNAIGSTLSRKVGSLVEFSGYVFQSSAQTSPSLAQSIDDAEFTRFRETTDRYILKGTTPTKMVLGGSGIKPTMDTPGVAITFADPQAPTPTRIPQDYGVYIGYYIRPQDANTDFLNVNVIDCNSFYNIDSNSPLVINNVSVYGGDTYNQKSYLRVLYDALPDGGNPDTGTKYESFISFYTQNRYNTQMRRTVEEGCVLFPADAKSIAEYLDDNNEDIYAIDEGYNEQNNRITAQRPYNKNINNISYFPSRIYYTAQRPTGSSYDSYRDISPFNFKDLDGKNGQISSLYDVNDTMISIQKYAVTVLPYQTDVLLRSDVGAEIYVGNGGVYAQRESIIGTYGTDVTTFAFRGYNNNGNASLYWFSEVSKKAFRYGRDGIRPISDDAKVRNFFLSRTKYLSGEFDLVMGFDTKRDVLWMTGFAVADTGSLWLLDTPYTTGAIVRVDTAGLYSTPLYYRALQNNTGQNPTTTTGYWEVIPTSDGDYYSIFTILYNEKLNAFTTERTVLPKRYFQYNNQLMVPSPYSAWGKVYEMNNGTDNTYFDGIEGEFFVQLVSNKIQNTSKRYISIGLNTGEDLQDFPTVDFETKLQSSTSTDFEQKNGNIWVAVEADANGEPLIGEYMKVKISSQNDITLLDAVSKIYYRPRLPR